MSEKLFLNIFRRIDFFLQNVRSKNLLIFFSIQKYSAKNKFAKKSHFEKDEEEEEDVANVSICFRDSI